MDIINEEETQFLKTLSRGQQLLERAIQKLDSQTLPGDIAWRLYDTYGFPVDLTQLMAEEKGLLVDMVGYEESKKRAQLISQAKGDGQEEDIKLDVHAIADLQSRCIPPTNDLPKYSYRPSSTDPDAKYEFDSCTGKVLAIRSNKEFVDSVENSQCGVILDRTCFYAESGGQIYDTGFMVKDDDTEFVVNDVQLQGGYVVHIGNVSGTLRLGDTLTLSIDEERRKLVMNNHTGTHILNFALRKVLTTEADQKGSLVAPDRLRFDFSNKGAMSVSQVKETEIAANDVIRKNEEVFAKDSPLALAKAIKGLRAVFGEVYPDPVRVLSVGVPVEELVSNPSGPGGTETSVEFCGGTHLKRSGHIGDFVISSEEAIAKGIRRIVALTGPQATKAIKKAEFYEKEVKDIQNLINDKQRTLADKDIVKKIVELTEDVSQSSISYWKKDEVRTNLKNLKKQLDDLERASKAAIVQKVAEEAKEIFGGDSKERDVVVHEFHAGANAKALDAALKQVKALSPNTAAMFFTKDVDLGRVICMCSVPGNVTTKGLKANEWVQQVSSVISGKYGGKAEAAQATGTNVNGLKEAMDVAEKFADLKLNS